MICIDCSNSDEIDNNSEEDFSLPEPEITPENNTTNPPTDFSVIANEDGSFAIQDQDGNNIGQVNADGTESTLFDGKVEIYSEQQAALVLSIAFLHNVTSDEEFGLDVMAAIDSYGTDTSEFNSLIIRAENHPNERLVGLMDYGENEIMLNYNSIVPINLEGTETKRVFSDLGILTYALGHEMAHWIYETPDGDFFFPETINVTDNGNTKFFVNGYNLNTSVVTIYVDTDNDNIIDGEISINKEILFDIQQDELIEFLVTQDLNDIIYDPNSVNNGQFNFDNNNYINLEFSTLGHDDSRIRIVFYDYNNDNLLDGVITDNIAHVYAAHEKNSDNPNFEYVAEYSPIDANQFVSAYIAYNAGLYKTQEPYMYQYEAMGITYDWPILEADFLNPEALLENRPDPNL